MLFLVSGICSLLDITLYVVGFQPKSGDTSTLYSVCPAHSLIPTTKYACKWQETISTERELRYNYNTLDTNEGQTRGHNIYLKGITLPPLVTQRTRSDRKKHPENWPLQGSVRICYRVWALHVFLPLPEFSQDFRSAASKQWPVHRLIPNYQVETLADAKT